MTDGTRAVPALMVAGTHSGVGKTTVASCLIALLAERGLRVRPYKLGPDYIDSGRHAALAGRPCLNLDTFLCVPPSRAAEADEVLRERFVAGLADADVAVIEAVGGLFDDWRGDGDSPAEIAKALGVPVLLVCDGRAACQTAGIAAGAVATADPALRIAGLCFPEVSGPAHLDRIVRGLPDSLQPLVDAGLVFALPRSEALAVEERHLGLVTAAEGTLDRTAIAEAARPHLPLEALLDQSTRVIVSATGRDAVPNAAIKTCRVRIAVARDEAFSFYYPDNLEALEDAGARLEYFSPVRDRAVPDADLLVFGGGFPELHGARLEANEAMTDGIRDAVARGVPVYAECGGFMYLCESFDEPDGTTRRGVGAFPFEIGFGALVLSYADIELTRDCLLGKAGDRARAHVFHRSYIKSGKADASAFKLAEPASRVGSDGGTPLPPEGFMRGSALGGWAHLHFASAPGMARHVVEKLEKRRDRK